MRADSTSAVLPWSSTELTSSGASCVFSRCACERWAWGWRGLQAAGPQSAAACPQQQRAAAKQYQAQAEDLALPVAESNEAGHHLQTEEELGRMLQEQLARIRSSWNHESHRSRETSEVGAEEAALRVARSPEGQAEAAKRATALPSKKAVRQAAQAEGLTLCAWPTARRATLA